jgi:cell shape-determining protein MreC
MVVEVSSERMPRGVVIGHIESFKINSAKTAYSSRIKLAADLSALDNVIIVESVNYDELGTIMGDLDK